MTEVDASKLPYPWAEGIDPIVLWGRSAPFERNRVPGALAAGSTLVTSPRTAWVKEGVLALFQDSLSLYLLDAPESSMRYESLANYRLKRGLILRKLTLRDKDGATTHFRIGKEMAANASYILRAKEVEMR